MEEIEINLVYKQDGENLCELLASILAAALQSHE